MKLAADKLPADVRAARRWPRAAVWGGALASTAMNLSANWHAVTVAGVTTFIAPTAHGLHLPEVTKLIVSAAFPMLLIFAVESAAHASLRWSFKDLGSYAMPLAAAVVFAFSVGEVTTLMLGMGMALPLALLFALAPDILITAGTVVLMRERALVVPAADRDAPVVPEPRPVPAKPERPAKVAIERVPLPAVPSREERPVPAGAVPGSPSRPAERPAPTSVPPSRDSGTRDDREAPAVPEAPTAYRDEATWEGMVETLKARGTKILDPEASDVIRAYRDATGTLPTANLLKMRLGLRHDRGTRLLRDIDSPNSGRADLHAVEAS
ncbi:MAG TPA: hypothetical protein VNO31_15425 [Umezawaea sp.]|nr:hypothetical protein [Umezawaea sp.]